MRAIDIASHQSVEVAGMDGIDMVIVKTTEGTGYVNPKADAQYQLAKSKGRLLGIYHYANGTNPVAEANYFYENSKGYIKESVPFLDWESGSNASWGDGTWCRKFIDRFHELTGVYCGIYVQASAVNQVANLVNDCPLWIAGYPTDGPSWDVPNFMYSTLPWSTYTLWQFTSGGGLDKNVVQVDAAGWKRIANPKGGAPVKPTPSPAPAPKPVSGRTLEELAGDVQAGKLGNGDARTNALGKNAVGVQAIVNHRANSSYAGQAVRILTEETKAGRYGDGDARKRMLGTYYGAVQDTINGPQGHQRVYTVQSGDTLSGIGAKLGVDWTSMARANGIPNPYTLQIGQQLKY